MNFLVSFPPVICFCQRLSPHHCCRADGTSSLSYPIARGAVPDSGIESTVTPRAWGAFMMKVRDVSHRGKQMLSHAWFCLTTEVPGSLSRE